jgi:hypothetical protein
MDDDDALDDDDAFLGTAVSPSPSPPRRYPLPSPVPQSQKRPPPLVKSPVQKIASHRKTKPLRRSYLMRSLKRNQKQRHKNIWITGRKV